MFKYNLRFAFRMLAKNKVNSVLNIFGLALGIACAWMILLWVEDEFSFDKFNTKEDRLYRVEVSMTMDNYKFAMESTPRPIGAAMKAEIPGVVNASKYSVFDNGPKLFTIKDKSLYAAGRYCDSSLFNMFTFAFSQGDALNPFPQLYSLVVTESTAKKFFGTEKNIIGRSVQMDQQHDYTITGVVKDMPENSSIQFEWLAPWQIQNIESVAHGGKSDEEDWGSYGPMTFVELSKNANVDAVNAALKDFIHKKSPDQKTTTFLFPMKDWRLYSEFAGDKPTGGGRISQVRSLSAIAWIILLIACINFMNLATASSQKRAKEFGVRKVLGAEKRKLIGQFMGEALMMAFLAAVVAIMMMAASLPLFDSIMGKNLQLDLKDPFQMLSLLAITVICGLVAGSYPSFYLSSFNPVGVLKGLRMKGGSAPLIRRGLVIAQFVFSIVFITGTIVVDLQIRHISNRDLGFNQNNLIQISPHKDVYKVFQVIKDELMKTGLFENVALADHIILYGGDSRKYKWKNQSDTDVSVSHRNVTPEYVSTSGMKIIAGRDFSENAQSEGSNVLINESMAKTMGPGSAIGKIIEAPEGYPNVIFKSMTVVGVVRDYVYGNIYGKANPMIIFCKPPEYQNFLYVRPKQQANIGLAISKIESVMKANNPGYPVEYGFVDEEFSQMYTDEKQRSEIFSVFTVLAVVISCLGLFGLSAFSAAQRTKEIGVRKVLGASIAGIARLLSIEFLRLVVIACVIAFPIAWWMMTNWLQNFEYRIHISWWIYAVAGLTALLIALATVSYQSIKASLVNPVVSLRTE